MTSPLPRISPADYEWLPDDDSHRPATDVGHDDGFVAAVAARPFMPWTPKRLDEDMIRGALQAVTTQADPAETGALTAEGHAHLQALRSRAAMSMRDFIALASLTSRDAIITA